MKTIEIEITKEDYIAPPKGNRFEDFDEVYCNNNNCPLAVVVKKYLKRDVFVSIINIKDAKSYNLIGTINPGFRYNDFLAVWITGVPFKTTLTVY